MHPHQVEGIAAFPTHVGVIELTEIKQSDFEGFPHTCGGDPRSAGEVESVDSWSPRMWG